MTAPTWTELLDRIAAVAFTTAVGRIAWCDVDDDGATTERTSRFWYAPGRGLRLDDDRGIRYLTSRDIQLVRDADGRMERRDGPIGLAGPDDPRRMLGGPGVANDLRNLNDFRAPEHEPEPTTVVGRRGWRVTLSPSPNKPYPLQLVVDDTTGTVLERRPLGTEAWIRLIEFEFDRELPHDVLTPTDRITTDRITTDRAEQPTRQEASGQRPPAPAWPTPRYWPTGLAIEIHEADTDTGEFVGMLQGGTAMLARWRNGAEPPSEAERAAAVLHQYRWSDERYDWLLAVQSPLAPDDVRHIVESIPAEPG